MATISSALIIYPNPTQDHIVLEYLLLNCIACKLKITDISGKLVLSIELENKQGVEAIDCASWNAGMYQVTLLNGNKIEETHY